MMEGFGCEKCKIKAESARNNCPKCGGPTYNPWQSCHNCGKVVWGYSISSCPIIDGRFYCMECAKEKFGFDEKGYAPDSFYRITYTTSTMYENSVEYITSLQNI